MYNYDHAVIGLYTYGLSKLHTHGKDLKVLIIYVNANGLVPLHTSSGNVFTHVSSQGIAV